MKDYVIFTTAISIKNFKFPAYMTCDCARG